MNINLTCGKFIIFWCILVSSWASENGGFLFTAPKTFLSGYNETVCISFRDQNETAAVKVVIMDQKEDTEIASVQQEIVSTDDGNTCFEIAIPRTKIKKGRLHLSIQLKTEEDFKINYMEQIFIQTNPDITFIQTDKPVYNGGHIVRFRIFTLRPDLTPVLEPVEKIWIENPSGIHLVQWLNEPTMSGFINKSFQLSSEPVFGKWFIRMKRNDEVISQSFLVENYILPKFFVTINNSELINFSSNVTVCAKYVFGKPVQGDLILKFYIKCSFSYYCQESSSLATEKLRLNSQGCITHEIILKNPPNFAQSLIINATVVEKDTQISAKSTAKIDIKSSKKKSIPQFSSRTKSKKFKPGLPFKGEVLLKHNETGNERILICMFVNDMRSCQYLIVKETISFIIMPVSVQDKKNFRAFLEVKNLSDGPQGNVVTTLNLVPWYSPSGSYIHMESLSSEPFKCGQKAIINVFYSAPGSSNLRFHYMMKSRGKIVAKGTLDQFSSYSKPFEVPQDAIIISKGDTRNVMQFQFHIEISSLMSPRSYLLVYFIQNDEIVADTLPLTIEKCLPNQVKTNWMKNLVLPGTKNNLSVKVSSDSTCAVVVLDKSTQLITNSENLNKDKILKETERFDIKTELSEPSNHCKDTFDEKTPLVDEIEPSLILRESDSRFVDSLQAFKDFGAVVITDLDLETRPCSQKNLDDKTFTNATVRNSKINTNKDIENISIFEADDSQDEPNLHENPLAYEIRTLFPETWIWDLFHISSSEELYLNLQVPHTLTKWRAETICLSANDGVGVSEPSEFITYKPFFVDFFVPQSLKRKEIFHLHVSVFNYEPFDLPIKITLNPSKSFFIRSEESRSFCIKTKSKIVHRFIIECVKLGEAQIMVTAEIDLGFNGKCSRIGLKRSDVVVKKTIIKHEGFPMEEVRSGFICGDSSNFDHQVAWNLRIPADVVESSISAKALVSGDILGPTLQNIDHLITLPTGCGEQNMVLLVPNVLLLDYLLLTKSEEVEVIERALRNLDLGYQKQLKYRHEDGSYSAFGEQDEKGSIWLTTFVVRYLSQAKKYVHIDENDLNTSVAWIKRHQLENGCFPMIGKVYHRKLQEKLLEEDSSKTLTAYVLISLIEAGIPVNDSVVRNGIYCLKPTEESLGAYGDLLSAYALILAGDYRESYGLMKELIKDAKRSYGMLWWESDDSIESAIEMTGYGILSLVKLGGPLFLAAASDAIRWIIQYQNQNGGFVSSQDTVLALEAISKFSSTLPRTSDHDNLFIQLNAMETKRIFNISNLNRFVQQEVDIPPYLTSVHFESSGKGCALVQTLLKYNIRRAKAHDNFKIQLRIQSVSDVDLYSVAKFHICVRYKSLRDKINMAVLEVPMVSGYYPDRASLYNIRISQKGVRRWEEYEDKVNFYFEDLKNRKVCVNFLVAQEVCVENAAPALIKLYDYYNTRHHTSVKYTLMRDCQNILGMDAPPSEVKIDLKRDLSYDKIFFPNFQEHNYKKNNFRDFVNFDHDLETPKNGGEVMPVFAFPPKTEGPGRSCPHCLKKVPHIFPQLYCSSRIALKVLILSRNTLQIQLDMSPRSNFTSLKKDISFTVKECDCPILNTTNTFALLLVTPPRTFGVQHLQEMHIDDSIQLYNWGNPNEVPQYLSEAINYCQSSYFN